MKQSLIYSAAIMVTLLMTVTAIAWSWFKYVRAVESITGGIVLHISGPDGRPADPYHYPVTISYSQIAYGLLELGVISFLLGMVCCWVFGSRRPAE